MVLKSRWLSVVYGVCFVSLILFTPGLSGSAAKPIVLKAGGISPPSADVSIAAVKFTEIIAKKTNGKLKVNFYPAGQLGNAPSQVENITTGVQDLFFCSFGWASKQIKDYVIAMIPYTFRSQDHLDKFLNGPVGTDLKNQMIKKWRTRVLAHNWWRLPKVIFAPKPIFKLEDIKGFKYRCANLPHYTKFVPAWGAVPTKIAWGEFYLALKQGLVDMGESNMENIYNMKFYEVAPYITMLNYAYSFQYVAMNEERYQSLSPEFQKALVETAHEAGDFFSKRVKTQFLKDKEKMKDAGAVFIEVSTKPWSDSMKKLQEELDGKMWSTGLLEKVRQIK